MENHTKVHSLNTKLADRTLWFDGISSFDPSEIDSLISLYDIKYVNYHNEETLRYNKNVDNKKQLLVKNSCEIPKKQWIIPEEYKNINVIEYVATKHTKIIENLSSEETLGRETRLAKELVLYHKKHLFPVLQTIIFIINTLIEKNIVWGVGRGSSVSSYVLYVIGLHDVDSYAYNFDINDFIK
jgi:DNA polymerase III alpha subunit